MKVKKIVNVCLFLTLTAATSAIAHEAGNGGGAFICPDPTQSEFFDLWESENPQFATDARGNPQSPPLPLLHIPRSNDPVDVQINRAFNRLSSSAVIYNAVMKVYAEVKAAKIIEVPAGVSMAWPNDEENRYIKAGCAARAIILFHDSNDGNSMELDTASLNALPNTDQAAAWVHETVYKFFRNFQGGENSIRSRQIVAQLFSDKPNDAVLARVHEVGFLNFGLPIGLYSVSTTPDANGLIKVGFRPNFLGERGKIHYDIALDKDNSDSRCKGLDDEKLVGDWGGGYQTVRQIYSGDLETYLLGIEKRINYATMGNFFHQTVRKFLSHESIDCALKVTLTPNIGEVYTTTVYQPGWLVASWNDGPFYALLPLY